MMFKRIFGRKKVEEKKKEVEEKREEVKPPEPVEKPPEEMKIQASDIVNSTLTLILDTKMEGIDVSPAEVILREAMMLMDAGDYEKVIEYADKAAEKILELKREVKEEKTKLTREIIDEAEKIIIEAKDSGVDTGGAEMHLNRAKEYLDNDNFERAMGFAKKSKNLAMEMMKRKEVEVPVVEEVKEKVEEEAKLEEVVVTEPYTYKGALCPGCGEKADKEWLICPFCDTSLEKPEEKAVVEKKVEAALIEDREKIVEMIGSTRILVKKLEKALDTYLVEAEKHIRRAESALQRGDLEVAKKSAEEAMKAAEEVTIDEKKKAREKIKE